MILWKRTKSCFFKKKQNEKTARKPGKHTRIFASRKPHSKALTKSSRKENSAVAPLSKSPNLTFFAKM